MPMKKNTITLDLPRKKKTPRFQCKKYHTVCKALCCGIVPIPRVLWQKKQHAIQRPVREVFKGQATSKTDPSIVETFILPRTDDNYCPFLKKDLSCAIYEDRPDICKKFGDESHPMMCCPMQHKDGEPRKGEIEDGQKS